MTPHIWILGRSGLLGSALGRRHARDVIIPGPRVPWADPRPALSTLARGLDTFLDSVPSGAAWTIHWAAGAGVIGSAAATFERETAVLAGFVHGLAARDLPPFGAFSYASSAAVYGGAIRPPFTESTRPAPTSSYAMAKHAQELEVSEALTGRLSHVIGRISTLYGPGQDMTKGQGLVSIMCLQAARRQPVKIFVPMDTLRDYIYVDDAAEALRRFVCAARTARDTATRVRVVASGSAVTVAELAARVRAVGHRHIGIHQAAFPPSRAHVRDLRLRSEHRDELAGMPWTPLPVGVQAVYADVMSRTVLAPGRGDRSASGSPAR